MKQHDESEEKAQTNPLNDLQLTDEDAEKTKAGSATINAYPGFLGGVKVAAGDVN